MARSNGGRQLMTKLSVNINKIATLRNARGENQPDLLKMALMIEALGADGITIHPRPDERHIKRADVFILKKHLRCELNIEGYPSPDFIALMHEVRPKQITLVPDPPDVLTSNAGFRLTDDFALVANAINELKSTGCRLSIFIDPEDFLHRDIKILKDTGADRIELYTKSYAANPNCSAILARYKHVAIACKKLGLGINAGHDLCLENLGQFLATVAVVDEVSIGHALICDALVLGMKETLKRYLAIAHASLPPHD